MSQKFENFNNHLFPEDLINYPSNWEWSNKMIVI